MNIIPQLFFQRLLMGQSLLRRVPLFLAGFGLPQPFPGGGFLGLSGGCDRPPDPEAVQLWLQVPDAAAAHAELAARGATILREPRREPWGLIEMWIADPDGLRICVVEVPEDHPLRYRPWPDTREG